jgi:hypothetical protein
MTPAEPDPAGLDPTHILTICAEFDGGAGVQAVRTPDGVRVVMPTRRAAWEVTGALGRVGYAAALAGDSHVRRDVMVTGWNADRLDSRLTVLRSVMHRLADNPLVTATAAVRRFAALPARSATLEAAENILGESEVQLRRWLDARAGICTPSPPAVLPADTGTAMRVRAVVSCEQAISDLVDRHLRVAGHAVALFSSLRRQMNDGRAQNIAVRRAGITFHLSGGSIAQDSTPLMRRAAPERRGGQPPRPQGRPRRGAAQEFPVPPGASGQAGPAPPAARGGLGGQSFPAARPGRHP